MSKHVYIKSPFDVYGAAFTDEEVENARTVMSLLKKISRCSGYSDFGNYAAFTHFVMSVLNLDEVQALNLIRKMKQNGLIRPSPEGLVWVKQD